MNLCSMFLPIKVTYECLHCQRTNNKLIAAIKTLSLVMHMYYTKNFFTTDKWFSKLTSYTTSFTSTNSKLVFPGFLMKKWLMLFLLFFFLVV